MSNIISEGLLDLVLERRTILSYLKNLKWEMVLYSILSIAIGVLMFLYPTKTLNAVCIILAVMLFALGIRYLIEYRKKNLINDFYRYEFVAGIALILLGIVVLACMNLILSIITYVIALIIIVSGLMKIENALFAIICIILGISVLTMPMNHNDDGTRTAGDFLIQCSGAIFAVTGLIDLITTLSVSGKIKKWIDSQMN